MAGDANGDGEFDIRDLIRLKKISAGIIVQASPATDFDGDKTVNVEDIVTVRKMLLGVDSSSGSAVYK